MPAPQYLMKAPTNVYIGNGSGGKVFCVRNDGTGLAMIDADSCASLAAQGWTYADQAGQAAGNAKAPYILAQSAAPTILLPAGTWNNTTGQLAVGTPLPYLPTGVVNVYLFASGIAQAGLYQATFTGSAASPVAQIVGNPTTVAGAYTPSLTETTILSILMPGGAMGANGGLRVSTLIANSLSGGTKLIQWKIGGAAGSFIYAPINSTTIGLQATQIIRNRGVLNRQVAFTPGWVGSVGGSSGSNAYTSIDTSIDQPVLCTAQLAATTDYIILEGYTLEVLPGA